MDGWLELPDGTRVGIERAHMEEDTGQDHPRRGGGPHPRRRLLAGRLQPVGRAAGRDRERARHARPRPRPGPTPPSCGPSSWPSGASDGKMEEGSMRVDANVSVRPLGRRPPSAPAARSRTSTRCARSAGPSSTRPTARSPCSRRASRSSQETRHWDEDAGPHPDPALQGGGLRLPLLPRARPGAPGPRRRVDPGRGRDHGPHARRQTVPAGGGARRGERRHRRPGGPGGHRGRPGTRPVW